MPLAVRRALRRVSAAPIGAVIAAVIATVVVSPAAAQQVPWSPMKRGSDNVTVLGHEPLGPRLSVADMELEQELHRPYAYVARMVYGDVGPKGTDIVDLSEPVDCLIQFRKIFGAQLQGAKNRFRDHGPPTQVHPSLDKTQLSLQQLGEIIRLTIGEGEPLQKSP